METQNTDMSKVPFSRDPREWARRALNEPELRPYIERLSASQQQLLTFFANDGDVRKYERERAKQRVPWLYSKGQTLLAQFGAIRRWIANRFVTE